MADDYELTAGEGSTLTPDAVAKTVSSAVAYSEFAIRRWLRPSDSGPEWMLGYNIAPTPAHPWNRRDPTLPTCGWMLENNYDPGSGAVDELHTFFFPPGTTAFDGIFADYFSWRRATSRVEGAMRCADHHQFGDGKSDGNGQSSSNFLDLTSTGLRANVPLLPPSTITLTPDATASHHTAAAGYLIIQLTGTWPKDLNAGQLVTFSAGWAWTGPTFPKTYMVIDVDVAAKTFRVLEPLVGAANPTTVGTLTHVPGLAVAGSINGIPRSWAASTPPLSRPDATALVVGDMYFSLAAADAGCRWWEWDGTYWLSEQTFRTDQQCTTITTDTSTCWVPVETDYDMYITRYVGSLNPSANDVSNNWGLGAYTHNYDTGVTAINAAILNTNTLGLTVAKEAQVSVAINVYVDTHSGTTNKPASVSLYWNKTGTSNLSHADRLEWRRVHR